MFYARAMTILRDEDECGIQLRRRYYYSSCAAASASQDQPHNTNQTQYPICPRLLIPLFSLWFSFVFFFYLNRRKKNLLLHIYTKNNFIVDYCAPPNNATRARRRVPITHARNNIVISFKASRTRKLCAATKLVNIYHSEKIPTSTPPPPPRAFTKKTKHGYSWVYKTHKATKVTLLPVN